MVFSFFGWGVSLKKKYQPAAVATTGIRKNRDAKTALTWYHSSSCSCVLLYSTLALVSTCFLWYPACMNIILECEYGSQAYGLATKDSDSDLLAVNVESPKYVTGLQESKTKRETTAGDGNRSQAGDTDRTIHPLHKVYQTEWDRYDYRNQ